MYSAILNVLMGRRKPQPTLEPAPAAPPEARPEPEALPEPVAIEPPGPMAPLVGDDGPVLVLVGNLILGFSHHEDYVIDSDGAQHTLPEGYGETVKHLQTPRSASELAPHCARNGLDIRVFEELESAGLLLRVDTSSPWKAAVCFAGLGLVPRSAPGLPSAAATTGPVAVHSGGTRAPKMYVSRDTAEVLWADIAFNLDLPAAISRVGSGAERFLTAERVLKDIPRLLQLQLATLTPPSNF